MLKRLTRKLFTLVVLCAALTSVASAPASSTNLYPYCFYDVVTVECPTGWYCCDGNNCWCA